MGLFGNWIKWLLLSIVTLGIYLFWVGPRIAQWKWEHTDFDPTWRPNTLSGQGGSNGGMLAAPTAAAELGAGPYQFPTSAPQTS